MSMTLYGICVSPYVRKVYVVAEKLGLEFDNVPFTPFNKPDNFNDISPLGKMPLLVDGDLTLADSSIICDYLVNQYGNNEFYPTDPATRGKALWFEEYADTKLVEVLGGLFYERVLAPKFTQDPTNQDRVDDILTNLLPPVQDYLESNLPDTGFILGEMSIADIAITTHFINASYAQYQVDGEKWPKLAAYIAMMLALPCFAKRMAEDAKVFS
ncbi:MAG: glutathione S-transferase [Phenylobacterium sp.]|jgi:glutathione S-transferase